MTRTCTSLALLSVLALTATAAPAARAAGSCPNEQLRSENSSLNLPDCRAYELVSPDSNHASLSSQPAAHSAPDGDMVVYQTIDAVDNATSASVFNPVRARRDPLNGWRGESLTEPLPTPTTAYFSFEPQGISEDLSSTFEWSDQPLSGGAVPTGLNAFLGRSDRSYQLLTKVGGELNFLDEYSLGSFLWGNEDFTHVYFQPPTAQLPSDPLTAFNTYSWSAAGGLHLVGILPDHTVAPNGVGLAAGLLQPASSDGRYVAFVADGSLYLRSDESQTVELDISQRTVDPDPNPPLNPGQAGITPDGRSVLFTSGSELTNDANTGQSAGVATDAGNDLYSYDTQTGLLTDLTVDTTPADAARGANVQAVVGWTPDASYIYFTATGVLAPGSSPGHTSLYVTHDGHVQFIANADGVRARNDNHRFPFYATPDGQRVVFASADGLTGYDSTDPVTGLGHLEVFMVTLGGPTVCVSCRADGTAPTADSTVPIYSGLGPDGTIRDISDDGRRVFFNSKDAVVPQASSGLQQVFQYTEGHAQAISPPAGSSSAAFLDASTSGDDVFFETYNDVVPSPYGGDDAVIDARIGGGFPAPAGASCPQIACQAPPTPAPSLASAASLTFRGDQNAAADSTARAGTSRVTVSRVRTISGTAGSLQVHVPGKGRLTVAGSGLQTRRISFARARSFAVRLALRPKALAVLRRRRSLKLKVTLAFSDAAGHGSSATLTVTFELPSDKQAR